MLKKWLKYRAERKRLAEEVRKAAKVEFETELLDPQFDMIQGIFGSPISDSLRSLYQNTTEILKSNATKMIAGQREDKWIYVAWYCLLNRAGIEGQWLQDGKHFAFAGDGSGSEWVVDPTDDQGEIYFFEHESEELKSTGVTMVEFLLLDESKDEDL